MRMLVKNLASTLLPEVDTPPPPAPTVYATAIATEADLKSCLAGITQICRSLGFRKHPETLFDEKGVSATYHADHRARGVALAVNCNTARGTVSLAVSGLDAEEALGCFRELERALFGDC